jgi:hypothetical protein
MPSLPYKTISVGDVGQGHRLELAASADGFLVESDRLPGTGELVQGSLTESCQIPGCGNP